MKHLILNIALVFALVASCVFVSSCNKEKVNDALVGTVWTFNATNLLRVELKFLEDKQFEGLGIVTIPEAKPDTSTVKGTYIWESPNVTMTATVEGKAETIKGSISGYVLTIQQDTLTYKLTQKK